VRTFQCQIIEELTKEEQSYAVELNGAQSYKSAYRKGHQWFAQDGTLVGESREIHSIRIPARRY